MTKLDLPQRAWYRRIDSRLVVTGLVVLQAGLGFSIILPFLPLYAQSLHATTADLAWMVTAFALAGAVSSSVGGQLSDRFGRRTVLVGGMVLFALATLLLAFAPNPALFIAARVAEGFGYGLVLPSGNTIAQDIAADAPEGERGRLLSLYSTLVAVGTTLGPAVGGLAVGAAGYRPMLLGLTGFALLAAFVAWRRLPETRRVSGPAAPRSAGPGSPWRHPVILAALFGATAVFLNNGLMQVTEVLYFTTRFGLTPQWVGAAFTVVALSTVIARIPGGALVDRVGAPGTLVVCLGASGLAAAGIGVAPDVGWAVFASTLAAFFGVMAFAAVPVLFTRHVARENRGRVNGLLGTSSSLALVVGAPAGLWLYGHAVTWPFFASGIVCLLAALAATSAFTIASSVRRN